MTTFTDAELKLIRKLSTMPPKTVLQIQRPCPIHSVCNPLPLFRVYKIDEDSFEAQWNGYHEEGPKQIFRLENVG
jgi:hypothetical protein